MGNQHKQRIRWIVEMKIKKSTADNEMKEIVVMKKGDEEANIFYRMHFQE